MTRISRLFSALTSRLAREGGVLALSTAVGQLLPAVASPFLARLYSPEQFGHFAIFAGVVSILSVVAGGRYELAVLLPSDDDEAWRILELTLWVATSSMALLGLLAVTGVLLSSIAPIHIMTIIFAAIAVVTATANQALGYWLMRTRQLGVLALSRGGRGALVAATSLLFSDLLWPAGGLILSLTVSYILVSVFMFLHAHRGRRASMGSSVPGASHRQLARIHRGFVRFSIPADLLNAVTQQLPLLVLQHRFGLATAGQFGMTQRAIAAPVGITSVAIGDVLKAHAADEWREHGHARSSYGVALRVLLPLAIVVLLLGIGPGPYLLTSLFGAQWADAARFVRLLAPYYAMALIASPLSRVLYIAGRQRTDLLWQIGLFVATGSALLLGSLTPRVSVTVGAFTGAYVLMYIVYVRISWRVACPTHHT